MFRNKGLGKINGNEWNKKKIPILMYSINKKKIFNFSCITTKESWHQVRLLEESFFFFTFYIKPLYYETETASFSVTILTSFYIM